MSEQHSDVRSIDAGLARQASGLSLGALFSLRVRLGPERVALEQGERRLSYAELDERTSRVCNWLTAQGVQHGDRIAILSENRLEYVELLLAVARMGVIAACQNWRQAEAELRHCLELVTPRLILVSPRFAERVREYRDVASFVTFGPAYEEALASADTCAPTDHCDPEDGVVILYTSGTTGLPKGALISHRAEIARTTVGLIDLPTEPDEAFVAWAPLFHMVSTDSVFGALVTGGRIIVTDGFDPDELAGIVVRERLGRLTLLPGMIAPFIAAMKRTGRPAVGVRWTGAMADLVPREQIAEVTQLLGAPFLNSFGSTETGAPPASGGTVAVGVVPQRLDKTQNSLCQIRLVDENDQEVADGEPGELAIRGPTLFSGYWNNPEANRADFRGGWFHMGDVFVRNPDGTLAFVDRRKYLIKSGGENIYPAEIERVLLAESRVADAVVVRKPDAHWGEVPVAFVVRRDESLTAEILLAQCREQIAGYKIPKEIRFVDEAELPRSTTGKIMRHELEERIIPPA